MEVKTTLRLPYGLLLWVIGRQNRLEYSHADIDFELLLRLGNPSSILLL